MSNKRCPACNKMINIVAFKSRKGYNLKCKNCGEFWWNEEEDIIFSPKEKIKEVNLKNNKINSETEIPASPKEDPLKNFRNYLTNLYKLCKVRKFDPEYVKGVRQRIFEIRAGDDYFRGDYCPEEILSVIIFEEVRRGKIRSERKKIKEACDILEELGVIELIDQPRKIIICVLHKPNWSIKRSQMKKEVKLSISKREYRHCNNLMNEMRNLEENKTWIVPLALSLGLSVESILNLIDLMNQTQDTDIISIRPEKKVIFGYRIKRENLNEREVRILKLRHDERNKRKEQRRKEDEELQKELERRQIEKERKGQLEEERIREIARQKQKEEEEVRRQEEEKRAKKILEEHKHHKREEAERRKEMKRLKWRQEIRKFTLIKILRELFRQNLIDKRVLKSVCNELNIETISNNPKELMTFINLTKLNPQIKVEALINNIPNFLEITTQIKREKYEIPPFAKKKEEAKKLLIEYLGGNYEYNPKTDLDKPKHVQQTLFKKPTLQKTIIVEAEVEKEKVEIHSKSSMLIKKSDSQSITAKEEDRFKEISDKLEINLENDRGEIELDSFIQKTGINKKDILEVLKTSEMKSKYQLNFRTTPVNFILPKKVTLRKVKRKLRQMWKMGILPKRSELAQLLELLEKKTRIEMSVLCENLNLPEDKIEGLLKELETHGGRDLIKYKVEEKIIRVVRKVN